MRLRTLNARDIAPITQFQTSDLDDVVIIAGANGSGKTRLKDAIIQTFQNPNAPQVHVVVQSTRSSQESKEWSADEIELKPGNPNQQFQAYMGTRTRGGTYTGNVIQIDSNRSVQPIKFQPISLATPDPDDEELPSTFFLNPFVNRWQDIVNKIFQKTANRDHKIAQYVKENPDAKNADTLKQIPDPFLPYQELFAKLLPGKILEAIDPKNLREFHYKIGDSSPLPFASLSAGEQEVVKIAFDLTWKKIRHCVIFVDEPELHLHPTLTFRLIETLKGIGDYTNQYFFFTHSADLISTYYSSGNVYFIDIDNPDENQAKQLSTLDDNHIQTARALGANLGIFAVGKKLVFVEGEDASVDRLTYHKMAQTTFPEAYILPTGSVENILALNRLSHELQQSIFGIDFFMIRDRDGLTDAQVVALESNSRFRCLKRRHVENYYLDAEILGRVAEVLYLDSRWHNAKQVEEELKNIAESVMTHAVLLSMKQFVTMNGTVDAPRITDTHSKSAEDVQQEFALAVNQSLDELNATCASAKLNKGFSKERTRFKISLKNDTWKVLFPGKLVLGKYCGVLGESPIRVRQAYLDIALKEKPTVFTEIKNILEAFQKVT